MYGPPGELAPTAGRTTGKRIAASKTGLREHVLALVLQGHQMARRQQGSTLRSLRQAAVPLDPTESALGTLLPR
ncbi:hypothetical protein ACIRO3_23220 [Streptomyces sp. NPDC102278]|uniref:hypothetical protein n=1 Tax=Streptomyces sp. NPDC102278 TaxID=3366152 RepID=UPI0037FBB1C9